MTRPPRHVRNNAILTYYTVESASGQDEADPVLWLATRARKLQAHLARSRSPILVLQEKVIFWPYNESCIDLACLIKMAGCWPCFFVSFFTDLTFVSVHNNINKNLINFQPSWPDMQGQSQHPICSQFASPIMYSLAPFYLMIFHQWN